MRSYFWGAAHAQAVGIDYDDELVLRRRAPDDLALVPAFDSHEVSFEEAGAQVAWVFAAGVGWSPTSRSECRTVQAGARTCVAFDPRSIDRDNSLWSYAEDATHSPLHQLHVMRCPTRHLNPD